MATIIGRLAASAALGLAVALASADARAGAREEPAVLKLAAGDLKDPREIRAVPGGDLVVLDARGDRQVAVRYSPAGVKRGELELPKGLGASVAFVDSAGTFYAASPGHPNWKAWRIADGKAVELPGRVSDLDLERVAGFDTLYVLDASQKAALVVDPALGRVRSTVALADWPERGFSRLRARGNAHLYAYAEGENLVYHYDATGTLVERFGSGGGLRCGVPAGYIGGCFDVAENGDVYWSLADYGTLLKYTADGKTGAHYRGQEAWNIRWTGPIHTLSGFAVSGDRGYVVDRDYRRITAVHVRTVSPGAPDCDVVDTRAFGLKFDLASARPYKLFVDAATDLAVTFAAGNRRVHDVVLRYRARDLWQTTVASGDVPCHLEGSTEARFGLDVSLPRRGWYQVDLELRLGDEVLMEQVHFVARTSATGGRPIPEKESSGWDDIATHAMAGMGLHRFNGDRIVKDVAAVKADVALARRLGVPYFFQIAEKKDATPETVRFLVENYPEMDVLEIVNEPNLNTSPQDYARLLDACYREAKKLKPSLRVLGPTQCGTSLGWFEAFFDAGGGASVDGVSVHTYMRHNSMDAYHWSWKLAKLREVMARHGCGEKPLYQTEHGYLGSYHETALRHRWQARSMLLEYMVCDRFGMWPDRYYYYYVNRGGFAGFSAYIVGGRRELFPAAVLMRERAAMIGERTYLRALEFAPPGDWLVIGNVYAGEKTDVVALVNCGAHAPVTLAATLPRATRAFDCFGNPVDVVTGQATTLAVDRYPLYLEVPHDAKVDLALAGFFRNVAGGATVEVDDDEAAARARFLTNGALEYDFEDEPERDGFRARSGHLPLDVVMKLDAPRRIGEAIVYGSYADNDKCTPLAYTVAVRENGRWKDVDAVDIPTDGRELRLDGEIPRITWYDNPWIFVHRFAPTTADAIRFRFTRTTFGQGIDTVIEKRGLAHRVWLREVQVFDARPDVEARATVVTPPAPGGTEAVVEVEAVLHADRAFAGRVELVPPDGWAADPASIPVTLSAATPRQRATVTLRLDDRVAAGEARVRADVVDARARPIDAASCVFAVPPLVTLAPGIPAVRPDGSVTVDVRIVRAVERAVSGTVVMDLRAGGKQSKLEQPFALAQGQRDATVTFALDRSFTPGMPGDATFVARTDAGIDSTARASVAVIPARCLGPFANAGGAGFAEVYPPERGIDVAKSYATVDGPAGWRPVSLQANAYLDLRTLYKTCDNVVAYTATWVHAEKPVKATLSCGSDDGIKAWVNGALVISDDVARGAAPGQERVAVDLKRGWNAILLKVTQGGGGWGLYFDLVDAAGAPLSGVRYAGAPGQ